MHCLPLPYHDELLYSAIARYGVHMGITSPKNLLDEVYNDRKVVATVDLPSHIDHIVSLYPQRPDTRAIELIYSHTLFPIYGPFVDENRRQRCIKFMQLQAKSSTHLALGVVASRIQPPRWLRYCPLCLQEQKEVFGEYHWSRNWQITGADSCLLHGSLIDSNTSRHSIHKHEFIAATHNTCDLSIKQRPTAFQSNLITQSIFDLLQLPPAKSASTWQWSSFYKSLLLEAKLNRGNHINYELLKDKIVSFWGADWLKEYNLFPEDNETSWLKTIFRKHRKSFSYLEHIVVWHSLLSGKWQAQDVLDEVSSQAIETKIPNISLSTTNEEKKIKYRKLWVLAAKKNGINYARKHKFGYTYAWLYRYDRNWLLNINSQLQVPKVIINPRIDWPKRDRILVKLLCKVRDDAECQLDDPRHSMNWYLSKLGSGSTVVKHLDDLPLCKIFSNKYCEDIAEYQIRRITRAVIKQNLSNNELKRWQILRMSGLSEQRLTILAAVFLRQVIRI